MEQVLKWLPAIVVGATVVAGGAVGQFQIGALASEAKENAEDIEENAEDIETIQRRLIERQGEIELDLERLRDSQEDNSEKLDEVLDLLRRGQ